MEEAKGILLLGAGGHCLSVLDSLLSSYHYNKVGIVDRKDKRDFISQGQENVILRQPIVGSDEDLEHLFLEGYQYAFVTVGSIGNVTLRESLYRRLKEIGFIIPNIIDKTSIISDNVELGEGIFIAKNSVINAGTCIGNLAIINTSSTIEHECYIEDLVHIAPGCVLCGNVKVHNKTHIGAGSVVKQGVSIGSNTMIGMGSIVLSDINSNTKAYGNPCREV